MLSTWQDLKILCHTKAKSICIVPAPPFKYSLLSQFTDRRNFVPVNVIYFPWTLDVIDIVDVHAILNSLFMFSKGHLFKLLCEVVPFDCMLGHMTKLMQRGAIV